MTLGGRGIYNALDNNLWKVMRQGHQVTKWHVGDDNVIGDDELHIGPNSVDITLAHRFRLPQKMGRPIDPVNGFGCDYEQLDLEDDEMLILDPWERVLGAARERFICDHPLDMSHCGWTEPMYFKPDIDGRSSIGRLFVVVHMTAGFGDFQFAAPFTLEIMNLGLDPIVLIPKMRLAQVSFNAVLDPFPYKGAYNEQDYAAAPVLGDGRF